MPSEPLSATRAAGRRTGCVALCARLPLAACALLAVLFVSLGGCPQRGAQSRASGTDPIGIAVATLLRSVAADSGRSDASVDALVALGEAVIPHLSRALDDRNEDVRLVAVAALGKLESPATLSPLIMALNDQSWSVRLAAVEGLGAKRDGRAVQPLLAQYGKDDDEQVRYECLTSLGLIGDPAAAPLLIKETASEDPYVRMWAMDGLCEMRDTHAPALAQRLLGDPNPYVVQKVTQSCAAALDTPAGHTALMDTALFNADFETTVWARRCLINFVESGAHPGLADAARTAGRNALAGDHWINAALLLGDLGDQRATEPLMTALANPNVLVRHHAAYCLGKTGDRRAVPALIRALQDHQAVVVLAAYRSLERFAAAGDRRAQAVLKKQQRKNRPGP